MWCPNHTESNCIFKVQPSQTETKQSNSICMRLLNQPVCFLGLRVSASHWDRVEERVKGLSFF